MREMKNSGVRWLGMIPKAWDLDKIVSLYSERSTKVSDRDYPALSVTKQGIVPQLESAAKTDNGDNRKLIKKNDFVINSRSDRRGSCGISEYEGSCSLINIVLAPKNNMVNQYYNYLFKTELFADEFYKWGNGIVDDLWSTKWSSMKNIMVPFPPLEEQRIIADYLDTKCTQIDTIIAKEQAVIEKLQEYKKALITEAVTKGLNPNVNMKESSLDWIGKVPETYSLIKLKFLGEYFNGLTYSPDNLTDVDEGVLVLRSSNIKNGKLVLDDNVYVNIDTPRYLVKKNDILICSRNGSRNLVGKNILLSEDIHAYFGAFMMIFRLNSEVYSKWVYYVLNSNLFLAYLGSFFSSTINQLTGKDFGNIIIPICDVEEAKQITECLDEKCSNIDSIILKKQFTIDKLIEYKKSLIYEVVTGKKEVPYV